MFVVTSLDGTCASSQLAYFIIEYCFLLYILDHLSHHQEELSKRENMHENTCVYPH
jgi:hypothetical protein